MIFVTGPRFAGKKEYIKRTMNLTEEEFSARAAWDVQDLLRNGNVSEAEVASLAEELSRKEIVTASEAGCGVIPVDDGERAWREAAGRLSCLLAARADVVIRVCCGLPEVLKGDLPECGSI